MDRFELGFASGPQGMEAAGFVPGWDAPSKSTFNRRLTELLGTELEPDTQFFVESWTSGLDRAAQNFHYRQRVHNEWKQRSDSLQSGFGGYDSEFSSQEFLNVLWSATAGSNGYAATRDPQTGEEKKAKQEPQIRTGMDDSSAIQRSCSMLDVGPSATREQIKTAYRRLVKQYHPDLMSEKSPDEAASATQKMMQINAAYDVLCAKRA